jgi:hypothetical protein
MAMEPEALEARHTDGTTPVARRRRRAIWGIGVLLAALGMIGAQTEIVLVTDEHNGEIGVSSYALREDDFHDPRLRLLRARENLDQVVAARTTQFDKIVALRGWVRRQWEGSDSFYYPPWDALEILDLARRHGNRGFCAQYAVVFLQACQSLGIHARYVDLSGHFVVAAWSDDFNRWVIMDPSNDLHYERDGRPMRGRDLYAAYWKNDSGGIVEVDSEGRRRPVTMDDLARYRLYSIGLLANQLSEPIEVKSRGVWTPLVHARDYRTYPRVGGDQVEIRTRLLAWRTADAEESFPPRPETRDPDQFRYAFNQTVMLLANDRLTHGIVKVALLSNNSPTFSRFLIRSEESNDWVTTPFSRIQVLLHPGMNELSARIETQEGWRGRVSSMRMFYKPPLIDALPSFRGNVLRLLWHHAV